MRMSRFQRTTTSTLYLDGLLLEVFTGGLSGAWGVIPFMLVWAGASRVAFLPRATNGVHRPPWAVTMINKIRPTQFTELLTHVCYA